MLTVAKSHDCYIEDEQGNSFVDTSMGSGAQIIGHGNHLIKKSPFLWEWQHGKIF